MRRAATLLLTLLAAVPGLSKAQDKLPAEALAVISCVAGDPWEVFIVNASSASDCDSTGGGSSDAHCCCLNGSVAACASSSGGGDSFTTINAPSGTDPVADSSSDTLNMTASGGLTITGDSSTDTLAFAVGNVATATALASNPGDCSSADGTEFAWRIAANGDLSCAAVNAHQQIMIRLALGGAY